MFDNVVKKRKRAPGAGRPSLGINNPRGGGKHRIMVGMAVWLRDALELGAVRNHRSLHDELVHRYKKECEEVKKVLDKEVRK